MFMVRKCANLYLQQDSNKQKFNDISTQDSLLHSSLEKSEDKAVCSSDICGTCELQEIELCLKLRSFAIYVLILCNIKASRQNYNNIFQAQRYNSFCFEITRCSCSF